MDDLAIQLEGVGKRYRLGEHLGGLSEFRDAVASRITRGGGADPKDTYLWALRDINLDLPRGKALGIVGRNGAGKSTFLKIVAGVTTPTTGVCRTKGRVGSLLEVGTGFNDELTGLENTFLSGAIIGMKRREVQAQLEEIEDFAGLEGFMDTPVKRYSSGMYLRLAFAVAAHLQAEILLVDEVLAVGDAQFRRKCLQKMSEVDAVGRTVLFASHDLEPLTEFCDTAIWIDGGRIVAHGPTSTVVRDYLSASLTQSDVVELEQDPDAAASLIAASVTDDTGTPVKAIEMGDTINVDLQIDVSEPQPGIDIGVVVRRINGTVLLDENLFSGGRSRIERAGRHRVTLHIPPVLTPNEYRISVWIGTAYEDIAFHEELLGFSVTGEDRDRSDRLIDLGAPWTTSFVDP